MTRPADNKTDAGNGSYGICRVIEVSRSPSPDPSRQPKKFNPSGIPTLAIIDALAFK